MKKFMVLMALMLANMLPTTAFAQDKCEGPQELCAQVSELKQALAAQKAASDTATKQQVQALQSQSNAQGSRATKVVAFMGLLAVILKIATSLLTTWKDAFFKSDKGKAGIRIAIIVVGVLTFLASNMGFGMSWWEALVLAMGGPLSMAIHELSKLIPVLRGKAALPPDSPVAPTP